MTRARPLLYPDAAAWQGADARRVMVFGMSGLGKTRLATMLRAEARWFHYSVDYRIGTRYMGEHIVDNCKAEAMKSPFLAGLLLSDSIYIGSNITFDNLAPLSTYLGKPGDAARGGLAFGEYLRRQEQHRRAEIAAMADTPYFIERAGMIYGYRDFICDTSGSICEVVDPWDGDDPVMDELSRHVLPVWIEGSDAQAAELIARFARAPKPMYYRPELLAEFWEGYRTETGRAEAQVDPDDFARWSFARALKARLPRYRAIAERWGVRVSAEEVAALATPDDFVALVGRAIERS